MLSPLAEKLLKLITERPATSFIEICDVDGCTGDQELAYPNYPNIIIWQRVSKACSEALLELLSENLIEIRPTQYLTYLIDGAVLKLPLAKKLHQYKKPHWLPMVIYPTTKTT